MNCNCSIQSNRNIPLEFNSSSLNSSEIEKSPDSMDQLSQTVERVVEKMLTPIAKALEKLLQMLSTLNPANQMPTPAQNPEAELTRNEVVNQWQAPAARQDTVSNCPPRGWQMNRPECANRGY